jgi:spore maturation protein CgeB
MSKWLMVLPPDGAARAVAQNATAAFVSEISELKTFDCLHYRNAFRKLLARPDDDLVVDLLNQSLVVQCLDFRATHLLIYALSPVTLFTLNLLRNQKIKTIHWFYEDYRRAVYWKDVAAGYEFFFAIQRGEVERRCRESGCRYAFLPTAAGQSTSASEVSSYVPETDVAFVGLPSPYRNAMLESLAAAGISLIIAGSGWDRYRGPLQRCVAKGNWTDENESAAILRRARIGLNLSMDDPTPDRSAVHVSPRVFDIMLQKRTVVTEDVPLAGEILDGYNYRTFVAPADAVAVIRDVLANPDRENASAERNRQRVLSRDTYTQRARAILALTA